MDYHKALDYSIALQRAIEYHCKGKLVPDRIAIDCLHHARMLNDHLTSRSSGQDKTNRKIEKGIGRRGRGSRGKSL